MAKRSVGLDDLKQQLEKETTEQSPSNFENLYKSLQKLTNPKDDWDTFKLHFEDVHPSFFNNIHKKHAKLTKGEMRYAAFIKMGLNTKEMASLLNVGVRAVEKARSRLRKKFELEAGADLKKYLEGF